SRDEIDELLAAQNAAPAVSLVMRPGLTDLDDLIDHGASQGRLSVFAASWPSGDPGGMELVAQGRVAVQDEGSQLAALALALGADRLAVELQEHRTELVDRAVAPLQEAGCEITTRTADGTTIGAELPGRFSRVLADVPCSGLGALRRRPEARWRRTPADIGQ